MRKEKGLMAIFVSTAILYLLLGVAFIQDAKSEDVDIWSIEQAKLFVTDDEMEWGVYYAVNTSLSAQVHSHALILAMANTNNRSDGYAMYSDLYDVLRACAFNGKSAQSVAFEVLGQWDDEMTLSNAMAVYFMDKCTDELKGLHGINHEDGGTES